MDLAEHSQAELNEIALQLDHRLGKTLGFHCPADEPSEFVALSVGPDPVPSLIPTPRWVRLCRQEFASWLDLRPELRVVSLCCERCGGFSGFREIPTSRDLQEHGLDNEMQESRLRVLEHHTTRPDWMEAFLATPDRTKALPT